MEENTWPMRDLDVLVVSLYGWNHNLNHGQYLYDSKIQIRIWIKNTDHPYHRTLWYNLDYNSVLQINFIWVTI